MNNVISDWAEEKVPVKDSKGTVVMVRFGDLLPILEEKQDVFKNTDDNCSCFSSREFVFKYGGFYKAAGYGDFHIPEGFIA